MLARRLLIASAILLASLLVLYVYWPGNNFVRPAPTPSVTGTASIGGPFTLVDTKAALNGHYSLVFFGYTYCPDICPLSLQTMTQALEMAGPVAESVLPVFITIDPERDTPDVMAAYITHFHPRFLALTGTPEQVTAAEKSYRVYAAKAETVGPKDNKAGGEYVMDHTGYTYLMGKDGKYVTHFQRDVTAADMAARLRKELNGQ
jgi:cytochrome oxidase Cu insertion factor (SCO1/SenC/PrrC family)